jgi:hypothetical protein
VIKHKDLTAVILRNRIKKKEIILAGNEQLKIYGLLFCTSGKRMKKENRVFFESEICALQNG